MTSDGGRVFFARSRRPPDASAEIRLVSVGADIGSSTSHLVVSRLVLQRRGRTARLVRRDLLHQSDILLTPYAKDGSIDAGALGDFVARQYAQAGIEPAMIDTGALILTGHAAEAHNARAVGALFADRTGRFVSVAAGDALETTLSAHGSGAVAASARDGLRIMNIDIGGGTSKIAVCEGGRVVDLTAVEVGARLIRLDADGHVAQVSAAGRILADAAGVPVRPGETQPDLAAIAGQMADVLFEACGGCEASGITRALLRLPPLRMAPPPDRICFSGGVADYIGGHTQARFGDLGPWLAAAVLSRMLPWGPPVMPARHGIRATVIGASQHSVQLSGHTIFVDPDTVLPLRDLPVIALDLDLDSAAIDPDKVAQAIMAGLRLHGLAQSTAPVALAYRWRGDATHVRLDAFCTGVRQGFANALSHGTALVLVGDSDVGGLIGLHLRTRLNVPVPIVSLDGIALGSLDFIDIGEVLLVSGGVPVVVKSLVFGSDAGDAASRPRVE